MVLWLESRVMSWVGLPIARMLPTGNRSDLPLGVVFYACGISLCLSVAGWVVATEGRGVAAELGRCTLCPIESARL
jgi:hypothetical protein